jgi:hypothetical protein
VIEHGLADAILPLDGIAHAIATAVVGGLPRRAGPIQPSTSESTSSAT